MKRFFLIFLINFVFISIQAQKKNCYCKYYNVSEETLEDKITCITLPNENIKLPKGEIYNQLSSGDIILNNGEKITDRAIRYDGVLDQLILPSADDRVKIAVEKSTLKGFDIRMFNSNKILHYIKLNIKDIFSNNYEEHYVQLLVSGKTSLYASRGLQHAVAANELRIYYSYILVKEDGTMFHFLTYSRRYITNLFPEKKNIFKQQLRKQRNRIRNEEQLILAIELYNLL